jgi:hypothetical protein
MASSIHRLEGINKIDSRLIGTSLDNDFLTISMQRSIPSKNETLSRHKDK